MYRLIALLLLCACTGAPLVPGAARFRDTDKPIYSSAVFQSERLAGTWTQVAGFGSSDCRPGGAKIQTSGQGLSMAYRLCSGEEASSAGEMIRSGPGRFRVKGTPWEWWVLWADGDYRTLVIGTPGGEFGYVLNRGPIPKDRMVAAKDILEWNGYDMRKFVAY